ncbi:heavy-metal-associated domain-containing protein [Aeromicrobium terrae]|uniref:Heavy-metal-associated domain-containing protein n=1 Tax=Aeromicrobium terrae TaxID=2498846 RepID=A0A5C8NE31_9ACTN|nr:copper ion binding protein [Aeromicrobium terrae]TXL56555.1 heavy-metal-associated domain-containing protein [Aeromicrobium terrae]
MTTETFSVTGMTCEHCVHAVSEEVGALDGVTSVDVDLVAGGTSTVTVTSEAPVSRDSVAEAVDEAGYALT